MEPQGIQCSTATSKRCQNTSCGGDVQTQTTVGYCDGQSAGCDDLRAGSWSTSENCDGNEVCNPETLACETKLGCGDTWCDPTSNNCWMTRPAGEKMYQDDAIEYCENLTLAGRQWSLPTANQLASLSRGCDGTTGTVATEGVAYPSTCRVSSSGENFIECNACPTSAGPTGGCYWPQEFGACPADEEAHWSTTEAPTFPGSYFYYNFRRSNMNFNIPSGAEYSVRCVALAQ